MGQQTESQGAAPKGAGGGHTPGPWSDGRLVGIYGQSRAGLNLAFVSSSRLDRRAECEANARLIAAAPDSHEANKLSLMVLCAIRAAGVLSHDQNFLRDLDSAIDANRAALAKAGGES